MGSGRIEHPVSGLMVVVPDEEPEGLAVTAALVWEALNDYAVLLKDFLLEEITRTEFDTKGRRLATLTALEIVTRTETHP